MRIIEHDETTGIQLQFHPRPSTYPLRVHVPQRPGENIWCTNITDAFDCLDKEVAKFTGALAAPEKLDLDHPPKGLQTQTGRAARVLGKCDTVYGATHVIAIRNGPQSNAPDKETVYTTNRDGSIIWNYDKRNGLRLITGPVKKEGWINIYPSKDWQGETGFIYPDKDTAKNNARTEPVTTVKITWEE